jgi:hypothetical protein
MTDDAAGMTNLVIGTTGENQDPSLSFGMTDDSVWMTNNSVISTERRDPVFGCGWW